jgi:hypothetical protein
MAAEGAAVPKTARGVPRGTQSFVQILALCWRRPSLVGLEVLWRWSFGIPLLALLGYTGLRIWAETAARLRATGVFEFSLQYPMQGAEQIADAIDVLRGPVIHAAAWLLPVAIAAWAVAAGLGRNAVLRRYRPSTAWRCARFLLCGLSRFDGRRISHWQMRRWTAMRRGSRIWFFTARW